MGSCAGCISPVRGGSPPDLMQDLVRLYLPRTRGVTDGEPPAPQACAVSPPYAGAHCRRCCPRMPRTCVTCRRAGFTERVGVMTPRCSFRFHSVPVWDA